MTPLTDKEKEYYEGQKKCYICQRKVLAHQKRKNDS